MRTFPSQKVARKRPPGALSPGRDALLRVRNGSCIQSHNPVLPPPCIPCIPGLHPRHPGV